MIVVDTNVLSELMREKPEERVLAWIDRQAGGSLFTTAVTEAEIRYGLALLPSGRRRSLLMQAADAAFGELFQGRVLPFDREASSFYATIAATRRASGRPISQFDCQIAAICRAKGAKLATRNMSDFIGCGIDLVDPWTHSG